jgi:hypothetical protein
LSGGVSATAPRRARAGAVIGALAAAAVASCFVGRKSSDFECADSSECTDGRTCDRGYCVVPTCPEECNAGCDLIAKTCQIACTLSGACGSFSCPTGFACTIQCSAPNACGRIACEAGVTSCKITCSTSNACGDIDCEAGVDCDVGCSTNNACGEIDCGAACKCNVKCLAGACDGMTCPSAGSAACANASTGECSSAMAGCATCP